MMLYHADLVSAIRLPNNLFTENANTEVGSDLIILQKNTQKESLRGDDNLLDTVYNDENRIPTNNYFLEHRNALSIQQQSWIPTHSANLQ